MNESLQILKEICEKCHKEEEIRLFKDDETKVKLRTLEGIREAEVYRICQEIGVKGLAYLNFCKIYLVAYSIIEVNGEKLKRDDKGILDRELVKIVGSWNYTLIDQLFLKYASLVGNADKFVKSLKKKAKVESQQ